MKPRFDVAIVGLGAMGAAAAWQVAARGRRVVGFDRFRPPHAMGSSTGRSRIIREAYWEAPFYVPLVRRAYELWRELEQRSVRPLLRPTGGLVIGPETGALVRGALASARAHDVSHEVLSAAEVRARYALKPEDGLVGVVEPRAGVLMPEDCISAMLGEAQRHGVSLRLDEPVLGWSAAGGRVTIRTINDEYHADRLILSAGAWMMGDLPGVRLPLTVARQVMFWLEPRRGTAPLTPDRCPVWLWETRDGPMYYGFPDLGSGVKLARHHGGESTTPDRVNRQVGQDEARELLAFAGGALPDLGRIISDARVCLYTNTPDEHFIIDRHPEALGVVLASPCSGHGFKFAPVVGEILADLVTDRAPRHDLSMFRLNRFPKEAG